MIITFLAELARMLPSKVVPSENNTKNNNYKTTKTTEAFINLGRLPPKMAAITEKN